jgi:lysophospholipase L1-like esterase
MKSTFALCLLALCSSAAAQSFTCAAKPVAGAAVLSATTVFPAAANDRLDPAAFGFDLQTAPTAVAKGACESDKPFFFSVGVPDGDYRVTVTLGGSKASTTTLRAESRRLLLMEKTVAAGASATASFVVNVRTPEIAGTADKVKLKGREIGILEWDNKLTLEFNGEHPAVRTISVERVTNLPTLYLCGDSTVVDQDKEPWAAWGQMLPMFLNAKISIANNAESGETTRSFVGERRWEKVLSTLKKGDYVMIQFAHNDQKGVPIPDYKDLLRKFVAETQAKGATPILVTAMNRRNFDADGKLKMSLGEYPQAARDVAAEQKVALIDLNAMSTPMFEAMGPQGTLKAFVHFPANSFPGQTTELKDDTHFNAYGAYELARAIVENIKDQHLPLEQYLRPAIKPFEPAHPDALTSWHLPASPNVDVTTPYGH